jgi:hypothetical protein
MLVKKDGDPRPMLVCKQALIYLYEWGMGKHDGWGRIPLSTHDDE